MEPIKYPWQQALLDAFVETDPNELREQIAVAETVIWARVRQGSLDPEEGLTLNDALRALQTLKRETKSAKKRGIA